MCGISGIAGPSWERVDLEAMVEAQRHRGPDDKGVYMDPNLMAGLGHNRLSIIDLSAAGHQPMSNRDSSLHLTFNGEIYNYLELRTELADYPFRGKSDSEVILAAYERWGQGCVDHLIGMFAFAIWDSHAKSLFIARDRFGVKPLYYHFSSGKILYLASEIKALHAAGVPAAEDTESWATYLTYGLCDHSDRTFWKGIQSLPAGYAMSWYDGALHVWRWYDLVERVGNEFDQRPGKVIEEEYLALLKESVRLRFRSDVPVGVNLSGGLDSSLLLGLVQAVQGEESDVKAFTFVTGDGRYDELPWVQQMLAHSRHPLVICPLRPEDVPELARSVQSHQDEPFGGLPTLAYARVFESAKQSGVTVLLDGQGMDEQWAGYEYYENFLFGSPDEQLDQPVTGPVQGCISQSASSDWLIPEFRNQAKPLSPPRYFHDALRNRQYVDTCHAKIPRALRFNDRISMRSSTELREPFLDHRLFELALRQPPERKISEGRHKSLLRKIAQDILPEGIVAAPKRPVQTPQREWLRHELKDWARECISSALAEYKGSWLDCGAINKSWQQYCEHPTDSSFHIWQWINLALWKDSSLSGTNLRTNSSHARLMAVAE